MKAMAFSFGTATPLITTVAPEGAPLGPAESVPAVATPDEPLPLPEDGLAPVDEPPLDGPPVAAIEPADGEMDPDINAVPLLVPPLVSELPLAVNRPLPIERLLAVELPLAVEPP